MRNNDIVQDLQQWLSDYFSAADADDGHTTMPGRALAEIERLRVENARLRAALRTVTAALGRREGLSTPVIRDLLRGQWHDAAPDQVYPPLETARAALAHGIAHDQAPYDPEK
jgi:hypothetical protein